MNMKDAIVPWKIEANAYFGTTIELYLLGERPNFDAFHCDLRPERELKLIWDDYSNKGIQKKYFISWTSLCKRRSDVNFKS